MLIRRLLHRSVLAAAQPLLKQNISTALLLGAERSEGFPGVSHLALGPDLTFQSVRTFAATALEEPRPEGSASDVALTKQDARSILQACTYTSKILHGEAHRDGLTGL